MAVLDVNRHVGLVDQGSSPLWDALRVDLADREDEAEARVQGEEVSKVRRLPDTRLHAVDGEGDRLRPAHLCDDLVDVRSAQEPEVTAGDPEALQP